MRRGGGVRGERAIGEAITPSDVANKHLARGRDAAGESDRWRAAALEESEALMNLRKKYVTENEVVYFERVPERPAKKLPEGKVIKCRRLSTSRWSRGARRGVKKRSGSTRSEALTFPTPRGSQRAHVY